MTTTIPYIDIHNLALPDEGPTIFYREVPPRNPTPNSPVLLLLHGFPSSSHQYRHLMPLLSTLLPTYRLIAPDFPSFGFTSLPSSSAPPLTFQSLATTLSTFLQALNITSFAAYIFDYGAPVLFRLLTTPSLSQNLNFTALITQNGNLYTEGLGKDFWAPLMQWWDSGSYAPRSAAETKLWAAIRDAVLTEHGVKYQYDAGNDNKERVEPEAWTLDASLLKRDGVDERQLQLAWDYRTNVGLYPEWQKWVRESEFPVLVSWGRNDPCFVYPGAEAYRKDVKGERLVVDPVEGAGHFALEGGREAEMVERIRGFLQNKGLA